jgi:hypothetical protein
MSVFRPAQGDAVHLVAECRSTLTGRVYEIGTPARVVGARGAALTLEVTGLQGPCDTLHCAVADVAHEHVVRLRQPAAWYRRRPRGAIA